MYSKFEYYQPQTISEAIEQMENSDGKVAVLNGGTDVIVRMNQGRCPDIMLDIKGISGLDKIEVRDDMIHIGALVRHIDLLENSLIQEKVPVLIEAVKTIGTPQVRNLGTLSGNICNSSPVADSFTALMILDAKVLICGKDYEREVSIAEFQTGPGKNVLNGKEIVKEIIVPVPKDNFVAHFEKLGPRKAADIAIVNVAVSMEIEEGICVNAKVALGAVAPKIIYAKSAQETLIGKKVDEINAQIVAQAAEDDATPISDFRSSKEYRNEMVSVLVERAIRNILE